MIDRDPEEIVPQLLIGEWDPQAVRRDFDHETRISDGWWDESDDDHQISVTQYDYSNDSESGYAALEPGTGSLISEPTERVDVNVWVYYSREEFGSQGAAKDFRKDLEREVRRIIGSTLQTVHEGEVELTNLAVDSIDRKRDSDDSAIFRSRIRVSAKYRETY